MCVISTSVLEILVTIPYAKINEIMPQSQYNDAEKGGFFVGFVREVPPYNSKHCKSIKGIFAFLTCRAKTTFFYIAKQKISSDPNTIKVFVVRVYFDLGEKSRHHA